jgi:hypothetical protein
VLSTSSIRTLHKTATRNKQATIMQGAKDYAGCQRNANNFQWWATATSLSSSKTPQDNPTYLSNAPNIPEHGLMTDTDIWL